MDNHCQILTRFFRLRGHPPDTSAQQAHSTSLDLVNFSCTGCDAYRGVGPSGNPVVFRVTSMLFSPGVPVISARHHDAYFLGLFRIGL